MKLYCVVTYLLDAYEPFFQDGPDIKGAFLTPEKAGVLLSELETNKKHADYVVEILESELILHPPDKPCSVDDLINAGPARAGEILLSEVERMMKKTEKNDDDNDEAR